jgi:hypothetical protein
VLVNVIWKKDAFHRHGFEDSKDPPFNGEAIPAVYQLFK